MPPRPLVRFVSSSATRACSAWATSRTIAILALACLTSLTACSTPYRPPADADLPITLRAGPNQHLDQILSAHGQTIYECRRDGAARAWTREGDLATLVDPQRRSVGTVAPGGYFTAYDNSYVVTRADAFAQVTAGTLVWARLIARQPPGSVMREGRFARTSMIQQVDTTGGLPPDPLCDREGGTMLVPFSATYLVYSRSNDAGGIGGIGNAGGLNTVSTHSPHNARATQAPWGGFPHPANGAAPLPND